jgi:hypothetical protein
MALQVGANSADEVGHGQDATLEDIEAGSCLAWGYLDNLPSGSASTLCTIFVKPQSTGSKTARVTGGDNLSFLMTRNGANLIISADLATEFATAFGADEWLCMALSWDVNGAAGDQKAYCGNLTTTLAEATSYTTQTAGSGTTYSDTGNDLAAWRGGADNTSWDGRAGMLMIWDSVQTLDHLISQQWRPYPSGQKLWSHYGFAGDTGTVLDLSGNGNTGTPTGTVVADHIPIQPWTLAAPITPYSTGTAVRNTILADMGFCRGRLPWMSRLPIPDGTIS